MITTLQIGGQEFIIGLDIAFVGEPIPTKDGFTYNMKDLSGKLSKLLGYDANNTNN